MEPQDPISDLDPSQIWIVMLYDDGIKEYAKLAEAINRRYAERHGYSFMVYRSRLAGDRAVQWDKVKAVRDLLRDKGGRCKLAMWIDADAVFAIQDRRIEKIFADAVRSKPQTEIVIASDIKNARLHSKVNIVNSFVNTGTFIVRNTEWVQQFMDWWWANPQEYRYDPLHEQAVISRAYNQNTMGANGKIKVVPERVINSDATDLNARTFVVHLMAQTKAVRIKRFTEIWEAVDTGKEPELLGAEPGILDATWEGKSVPFIFLVPLLGLFTLFVIYMAVTSW